MWFYLRILHPKDADRMTNSENHDHTTPSRSKKQSDLGRKRFPRVVIFTFSDSLGLRVSTFNWKQSITQPKARRHEGCCISHYLS